MNRAEGDPRQMKKPRQTRPTEAQPAANQSAVELMFPAIAAWVRGFGHIEVGDQESLGFVVRALDYGGLVFENDSAKTLAEALAALEQGLAKYFADEGIEIK
jgi:hypothetical protein